MVATATPERTIQSAEIRKEILINAPMATVFETIFEPVGPLANMNLKIERSVGGRWYRDLGNGAGHLWGHVQVLKPPYLLELNGPMMMSYPAVSHVQYRLTEEAGGTKLKLIHQMMGLLTPEHTSGVSEGWQMTVDAIKGAAEKKV